MSEAGLVAIAVASIAGVPGILAAILANRGRQHARAARTQVENDHTTNLRDDNDGKHDEILKLGGLLTRLVLNSKADIRGMRKDVGRVDSKVGRLDDKLELLASRVDEIEGHRQHERTERTDTRQHSQRAD